jgi:hypothetical protein
MAMAHSEMHGWLILVLGYVLTTVAVTVYVGGETANGIISS